MERLRILYVGTLYPNTPWVPTSRSRMQELGRLGCDIIPLDDVTYTQWGGRLSGGIARRLRWGPPLWRLNRDIVDLARRARPHVLWVDKGLWVTADALRRVRGVGTRFLVHYTPDPAFVF